MVNIASVLVHGCFNSYLGEQIAAYANPIRLRYAMYRPMVADAVWRSCDKVARS